MLVCVVLWVSIFGLAKTLNAQTARDGAVESSLHPDLEPIDFPSIRGVPLIGRPPYALIGELKLTNLQKRTPEKWTALVRMTADPDAMNRIEKIESEHGRNGLYKRLNEIQRKTPEWIRNHLLTRSARDRLEGRDGNELERLKRYREFNEKVGPALRAMAVQPPLRVGHVREMRLGQYQGSSGGFPIRIEGRSLSGTGGPGVNYRCLHPNASIDLIGADESEASELLKRNPKRVIYVLETYVIREIGLADNGIADVQLDGEVLAVFEPGNLEKPLAFVKGGVSSQSNTASTRPADQVLPTQASLTQPDAEPSIGMNEEDLLAKMTAISRKHGLTNVGGLPVIGPGLEYLYQDRFRNEQYKSKLKRLFYLMQLHDHPMLTDPNLDISHPEVLQSIRYANELYKTLLPPNEYLKYFQDFGRLRGDNEFELRATAQRLLAEQSARLKEIAIAPPLRFKYVTAMRLGEYDFQNSQFPIESVDDVRSRRSDLPAELTDLQFDHLRAGFLFRPRLKMPRSGAAALKSFMSNNGIPGNWIFMTATVDSTTMPAAMTRFKPSGPEASHAAVISASHYTHHLHVHDLAVSRNPFANVTISSEPFGELQLPRSNGIDDSAQPLRSDLILANRDAQLSLLLQSFDQSSENAETGRMQLYDGDWVAAGKRISEVDRHYYQTGQPILHRAANAASGSLEWLAKEWDQGKRNPEAPIFVDPIWRPVFADGVFDTGRSQNRSATQTLTSKQQAIVSNYLAQQRRLNNNEYLLPARLKDGGTGDLKIIVPTLSGHQDPLLDDLLQGTNDLGQVVKLPRNLQSLGNDGDGSLLSLALPAIADHLTMERSIALQHGLVEAMQQSSSGFLVVRVGSVKRLGSFHPDHASELTYGSYLASVEPVRFELLKSIERDQLGWLQESTNKETWTLASAPFSVKRFTQQDQEDDRVRQEEERKLAEKRELEKREAEQAAEMEADRQRKQEAERKRKAEQAERNAIIEARRRKQEEDYKRREEEEMRRVAEDQRLREAEEAKVAEEERAYYASLKAQVAAEEQRRKEYYEQEFTATPTKSGRGFWMLLLGFILGAVSTLLCQNPKRCWSLVSVFLAKKRQSPGTVD